MTALRLLSVAAVFLAGSATAQIDSDFELPEKWERDFTITLSYHSSMGGGSTDIRFTYDSCIYKSSSRTGKPVSRVYLLKESDRVAILAKLHELKADRIKSEHSMHPVRDGWSQSICFNVHCIDGGTSAEMNEENKNRFLDAYRYLEEFAMKKWNKTE